MDLTEPENRRSVSYGTSRFEGSDAPAPSIIRTLDGHIVPPRVEVELTEYTDEVGMDLTNVYCCDDEY